MRIVIEVNITENRDKMNDKKLREAIIVSLSIKRCLDGWINKVEELERNAIENGMISVLTLYYIMLM